MLIFNFIIGSCFGSFISLLCFRFINKESIVFPGSHCEKCYHQIPPYDLIPILSFITLKGKCRYCHQKISKVSFTNEIFLGFVTAVHSTFNHPVFILIIFFLTFLSTWDMLKNEMPLSGLILFAALCLLNNSHDLKFTILLCGIYIIWQLLGPV